MDCLTVAASAGWSVSRMMMERLSVFEYRVERIRSVRYMLGSTRIGTPRRLSDVIFCFLLRMTDTRHDYTSNRGGQFV